MIQEHYSFQEIIRNQFLFSITGWDFDLKRFSSSALNNIEYYIVCQKDVTEERLTCVDMFSVYYEILLD